MAATDAKVPLSESTQYVVDHLRTLGYEKNVVMLSVTGKTSVEAAVGLGCSVIEIAKSIILYRVEDDVPMLVIASDTNRVDEAKVFAHAGMLAKADAKFVREKTGYTIGSVCPVGHTAKPVMLLDQDLFQYDSLWAAAGHPHAVPDLTPAELEAMAGTSVIDTTQRD